MIHYRLAVAKQVLLFWIIRVLRENASGLRTLLPPGFDRDDDSRDYAPGWQRFVNVVGTRLGQDWCDSCDRRLWGVRRVSAEEWWTLTCRHCAESAKEYADER